MDLHNKIQEQFNAWFDANISKIDDAPYESHRPKEGADYVTSKYQTKELLKEQPSIEEVMYWEGSMDQNTFYRQKGAYCELKPFTISPVILYPK
jgi:hypothetical protein